MPTNTQLDYREFRPTQNFDGFEHYVVSTTGTELLTDAEAKAYAGIEGNDDDTVVGILRPQARVLCESYLSRDIVAKQRVMYFATSPQDIELYFSPVATVDSITADGDTLTEGTDYELLGDRDVIVRLTNGSRNKLKITYTTMGISDTDIKGAIARMFSNLYDSRNDMGSVEAMKIPQDVLFLLTPYMSGRSIIL